MYVWCKVEMVITKSNTHELKKNIEGLQFVSSFVKNDKYLEAVIWAAVYTFVSVSLYLILKAVASKIPSVLSVTLFLHQKPVMITTAKIWTRVVLQSTHCKPTCLVYSSSIHNEILLKELLFSRIRKQVRTSRKTKFC